MPRVVTLITDFGTGSGYVAEMKGCLLQAQNPFTLIDIAHDLPAQDLRATAWLVGQACFAFPAGSLHIVVVDPGVGTVRRLLWARIGDQEFLCPDNGLLTRALAIAQLAEARELCIADQASATFHGRDVLAPAAKSLLDGAEPASLGSLVGGELLTLPWPVARITETAAIGEVIHVDRFGNLVTNLPAHLWPRVVAAGLLHLADSQITRLVRTYGEAAPGTVVALVGSQGLIEVAVVEGNAAKRLAAGLGAVVVMPA
jgi:S-adenosyl-L-methionine hydrolase (adenosine-forming)